MEITWVLHTALPRGNSREAPCDRSAGGKGVWAQAMLLSSMQKQSVTGTTEAPQRVNQNTCSELQRHAGVMERRAGGLPPSQPPFSSQAAPVVTS